MDADLFRGVVPFVVVAEELSFRRAASRLGLTPAAVSKAVITLEAVLQVKLLQRSSRAVSLTRDGALFFERCRGAVASVVGARAEMASARRAPHGEATVSAPFVLAPIVVRAIAQLRHRHPRLTVRLHVTDAIARLAAESVDVAVRIGGSEDESLAARLLRTTRWITVASPAYLARRPAPTAPAELADHECLVFVGPNGRPRPWHFTSENVAPPAALLTDHAPSMLAAALAGMGVCQVFDHMVADELRLGQLVAVLEDVAAAGPPVRALCAPGRRTTANVRAISDSLADAFAVPTARA